MFMLLAIHSSHLSTYTHTHTHKPRVHAQALEDERRLTARLQAEEAAGFEARQRMLGEVEAARVRALLW